MSNGYQVIGPITDPIQQADMQAYVLKSVVGLALFVGFLYWWANR